MRKITFFKTMLLAIMIMVGSGNAWGQLYWNTNGTSANWTDANWGVSASGPYNNAWILNSDVVFIENSSVTFATTSIGNITVSDGKSVTITQAGTLKTNNQVRTINIGSGSSLIWTGQSISTTSGTGFIKNGSGTWNIGAQPNDYTGGFTLNDGTVIVTGGKSFGGANSLLTINGGTINITGGTTHSNNINIGGDFTLTGTGNTTFSGTVNIGSATRTITNSLTGVSGVSRIFSGIISGVSGSGLTFNGSSSYPIYLSGKNTYDGITTINGSTLILNATGGALKSGNAVTISGGTLEITQSQTIGDFSMTSGILKVDADQTLTITGTYNVSGGTINNQGTIILQGSTAQSFPGSSTIINNGTSGLMTNLIINNNSGVSFDKSFSVTTLTINPNAKLTNSTGKTLTISTFNIHSDDSGTGTYIDNGTTTITGTANVNQNLASYRTYYMSSPVASATSLGMNRIKYYDETTGAWSDAVTTMAEKIGYLVVPDNVDTNIQFSGTLNTGTKTFNVTRSAGNTTKPGFNLIGNPYPSFLDWTALYANSGNAALLETSTMWYRTKSGSYAFWTVNGASGEGAGPVEASPFTITNQLKYIPPMQSFWVRTSATGTLTMDNTMRMQNTTGNANLMKAPAANTAENALVRVQVSNGTNFDHAVIYFNTNASNGYDIYDSPKMSNEDDAIAEIFTRAGSEQLVINGMKSIPLDTEIALGFIPGSATSFILKASEVRNLPSDVKVILKDNVTKAETDITDGSKTYSFSPLAATGDRFSIIFRTTSATTGLDNHSVQLVQAYSNAKNQLTVLYKDAVNNASFVSVYNAMGQRLVNQRLIGNTTVLNGTFPSGVYIVNINNVTRKVVVE